MSTRTLIRLFLPLFLTAITGSLSAALPTRDLAGKKGPLLSRTDNPNTLLASFTYVLDKGGATAILKALDRAIAAEKDAASLTTLKKARTAFVANPAEAIRQVAVAGSWNGWNAGQLVLGEEKLGGFVAYARQCDLSFTAPKELYGYLFTLAAGEGTVTVRVTDPLAPQTIEDGIGGTLGLLTNRWFRGDANASGSATQEFERMIAKATRGVEACMKDLDAAKTPEDLSLVGEKFTMVTQNFQNEMVEFGKKNPTPPSEADQKMLMESLNQLNELMTSFSSKFAEGQGETPAAPAEEAPAAPSTDFKGWMLEENADPMEDAKVTTIRKSGSGYEIKIVFASKRVPVPYQDSEDSVSIKTRIDSGTPEDKYWARVGSYHYLAPDPESLLKNMRVAERMILRFVPYPSSELGTFTFEIAGLASALETIKGLTLQYILIEKQ